MKVQQRYAVQVSDTTMMRNVTKACPKKNVPLVGEER